MVLIVAAHVDYTCEGFALLLSGNHLSGDFYGAIALILLTTAGVVAILFTITTTVTIFDDLNVLGGSVYWCSVVISC